MLRQHPETGERSLDLLKWRVIPYWCKEKPKPPPINAKVETVERLPMFRDAYARRRCIMPIDGFFEWQAIKGEKVKQPYAIAMKSRSPTASPCIRGIRRQSCTEHWPEQASPVW